jgi:hypothetical protein
MDPLSAWTQNIRYAERNNLIEPATNYIILMRFLNGMLSYKAKNGWDLVTPMRQQDFNALWNGADRIERQLQMVSQELEWNNLIQYFLYIVRAAIKLKNKNFEEAKYWASKALDQKQATTATTIGYRGNCGIVGLHVMHTRLLDTIRQFLDGISTDNHINQIIDFNLPTHLPEPDRQLEEFQAPLPHHNVSYTHNQYNDTISPPRHTLESLLHPFQYPEPPPQTNWTQVPLPVRPHIEEAPFTTDESQLRNQDGGWLKQEQFPASLPPKPSWYGNTLPVLVPPKQPYPLTEEPDQTFWLPSSSQFREMSVPEPTNWPDTVPLNTYYKNDYYYEDYEEEEREDARNNVCHSPDCKYSHIVYYDTSDELRRN